MDNERERTALLDQAAAEMKERREEYIETNRVCCPWCKSTNIKMEDTYFDDNRAYADYRCENCKKEWRDHYRLTDMEEK